MSQTTVYDTGHVYHDFASGVRDDRPGLDSCVRARRPGDVLVVWKLDRLGRTFFSLSASFVCVRLSISINPFPGPRLRLGDLFARHVLGDHLAGLAGTRAAGRGGKI